MNKYLKNRYILVGLIGLAFYIYKRRQILKKKPQAIKPVEELDKEIKKENLNIVEDEPKVGEKFINDVEKMSNTTLKRTMETNKTMLKRAKLSDKKKEMIGIMLDYMKKEYANRTRNK